MRPLSLFLCFLIAAPFSPRAGAQTKINIVVVEGEGAINNIRQRTARDPIVQVEDENHKPIAGAAVVFLLPSQGPGGAFASGDRMLTVMSDSQGRAAARGLRANNISGRYEIRVNASYQGQTATAAIAQSNVMVAAAGAAAAAGISAKLIAILAIGAAAVAGGVVAATRGSDTPSTSVAAGTSTVGAPR
jgi:hypothetical protein